MEKQRYTKADFQNDLEHEFASKGQAIPQTKLVRSLYEDYRDKLTAPRLTFANVVRVVSYANKHHLPEKDYGKVIKKVAGTGNSVLTYRDFRDIYMKIARNVGNDPKASSVSADDVDRIFDATFTHIKDNLAAGKVVSVPKFGQFEKAEQQGRYFRNPASGKKIYKESHGVPKFRASAALKRMLYD